MMEISFILTRVSTICRFNKSKEILAFYITIHLAFFFNTSIKIVVFNTFSHKNPIFFKISLPKIVFSNCKNAPKSSLFNIAPKFVFFKTIPQNQPFSNYPPNLSPFKLSPPKKTLGRQSF